jgi:phosphatidylglycerophosphate synthase
MKTAGRPPITLPSGQGIAERCDLARDAARDLSAMAALVLLIALGLALVAGMGMDYALKAGLVFAVGAWLVWRGLSAHPHPRFGPANRVTLVRLVLLALIAALLGEPFPRAPLSATPTAAWCLAIVAAVTALLDAVDGVLARRSGLSSAFGARFDMETDAAFTLVLCMLVVQSGQAGPWILAAGLMRYGFVVAALAWPWLSAPLPSSKRRQTVCAIQITTLIACLAPIVPPLLAASLAAISLTLLNLSFATDMRTLAQQRPTPPET